MAVRATSEPDCTVRPFWLPAEGAPLSRSLAVSRMLIRLCLTAGADTQAADCLLSDQQNQTLSRSYHLVSCNRSNGKYSYCNSSTKHRNPIASVMIIGNESSWNGSCNIVAKPQIQRSDGICLLEIFQICPEILPAMVQVELSP